MKLICYNINNELTFYYIRDMKTCTAFQITDLNATVGVHDFKWLFNYLGSIFKPLEKIMDCEVKYEERYKNDEWDTYCDTFVIHTFTDGTQFISEYYDLNDECNKNNTVEEALRFIAEKCNIDLEYKEAFA